jgi:hypothetical protein
MSINAIRAPAQFELEEAPVPSERCVDVVDLQRHVVDADQPRHQCSA